MNPGNQIMMPGFFVQFLCSFIYIEAYFVMISEKFTCVSDIPIITLTVFSAYKIYVKSYIYEMSLFVKSDQITFVM